MVAIGYNNQFPNIDINQKNTVRVSYVQSKKHISFWYLSC
jgi:hypothetical protein